MLDRLVSSAPTLEFLSLSHKPRPSASAKVVIPIDLFNCTAPSLTSLELKSCDISWKSPLLKRLRSLEILRLSTEARPTLEDWLGALNEMPQLETLIRHPTCSTGRPIHFRAFARRYPPLPHQIPYNRLCERLRARSRISRVARSHLAKCRCQIL